MLGKEVQNTGGITARLKNLTTPVVFIGKKQFYGEGKLRDRKPYLWTVGKLRLWRGL